MDNDLFNEVLSILPIISGEIVSMFENFNKESNMFGDQLPPISEDTLEQCNKMLEYNEKHVLQLEDQIEKNMVVLKKLNNDVEQQKNKNISLKSECAEKKELINILELKCSKVDQKMDKLSYKRNIILTCKLLTNTIFYKDQVMGYTFNSVNKLVKPFDFKRTKHSKQQIINQLYDHLKTIFSTQSSIIFDEINN